MKFKIIGADRETGEDQQVVLDAPSREAACDEANRLGLMVADCAEHGASPPRSAARTSGGTATCPDCGAAAQLSPDRRRGQCDSCGKVFTVSAPSTPVLLVEAKDATKVCPFCAETINAKAIKCRWCGEMLTADAVAQPTPAPSPLPQASAQHPTEPRSDQPRPQSSVTSRFARGGIIGVFNENACMPEEQMRLTVKGRRTPAKKAKRIGFLASVAVSSFIALIVLAIGLGALFSGDGSSESSQNQQSISISPTTFVDFDSKFCVHSRLTDLQKSKEIESYKGQRVRWEGVVSYVSDDSVGIKHKATTATYDVLLHVLSNERSALTSLNNGDSLTYEGTIEDYGTIMPHDLHDGHIVSSHPMSSGDQLVFLAKTETAVLKRIGGKADDE